MDDFKEYPDSQYGEGVILDEYNGTFSLVLGNKGKDDKVYKKWGYPQGKDRGPIDKSLPWKIPLGDSISEAMETLTWAAKALKAKEKEADAPF